jgi:hypothetical protein
MRMCMIVIGAVVLIEIGCGQDEKIAKLEKQNQELTAEVDKSRVTGDYDLQARCSKDAKTWFNENWSRDKGTELLDFTNHYNKSLNKCFILTEYHYDVGLGNSWMNDVSLWDVYENLKYANFGEYHMISFKPTATENDRVFTCEVFNKNCKALQEFNELVRPYMNN